MFLDPIGAGFDTVGDGHAQLHRLGFKAGKRGVPRCGAEIAYDSGSASERFGLRWRLGFESEFTGEVGIGAEVELGEAVRKGG